MNGANALRKAERAGPSRSAKHSGKMKKPRALKFALEKCAEMEVAENRTWRDRLRPPAQLLEML